MTSGRGQATVPNEERSKGGPCCGGFLHPTSGKTKGIFGCGRRSPCTGPGCDTAGDGIHTHGTAARTCNPEAHKRRTKTWICETQPPPPPAGHARPHTGGSRTAALGDVRGTQASPQSAHWPRAAPQHADWGADESVNRPRWARGGAEGHTPAPKWRVPRTPTSRGPLRGVQGALGEAGRGQRGDKRQQGHQPPLPEGKPPCKRARLRGRPVERHGRASTEAS